MIRKLAAISILLFLLTSCNLPRGVSGFSANARPGAGPTDTPTTDTPYFECGWSWGTQSLPDLSAEVQSALETTGLTGVTAYAEAYGENCFTTTGEGNYFAAMETDFRILMEVSDLADTAGLGNQMEQILTVLDAFPPEDTPGPQSGYIGITFTHDEESINLWFTVTEGSSARALGLHGADLFSELLNR